MDETDLQIAGGVEWGKWLRLIGRGRTTGYSWRKPRPNGEPARIKTCNIGGKNYIRSEEIKRFWDRAEAGEFSKEPVVPARPSKPKTSKKPNANGDSKDA